MKELSIDYGTNPFLLRLDLDGDGVLDYALRVRHGSDRGILVCWGKGRRPTLIGAGTEFDNMADLNPGAWRVYPKSKVAKGVGEHRRLVLRGEALELIWPERASGLAYWNGHELEWYQQSD
jgi:hypothetical protein